MRIRLPARRQKHLDDYIAEGRRIIASGISLGAAAAIIRVESPFDITQYGWEDLLGTRRRSPYSRYGW